MNLVVLTVRTFAYCIEHDIVPYHSTTSWLQYASFNKPGFDLCNAQMACLPMLETAITHVPWSQYYT